MSRRFAVALFAGILVFAAFDLLAFRAALYKPFLDPNSSTGSFELALERLRAVPSQPARDVLVLGDSRVYSGLNPAIASAASGGGLRFWNAGVPGTTPRCWYYFDRALDPRAHRFAAVVVPVDTLADDTGAIGALDAGEREMDLHYIVFRLNAADALVVATSFADPHTQLAVFGDLLLRGPELRSDLQAFVADPAARLRALAAARGDDAYDPFAAHPRVESLGALRVDFAHDRIARYPAQLDGAERRALDDQLLRRSLPSPAYARYRQEWLAPLVRRYAASGVPVVFVRIPTRPLHRTVENATGASLRELVRDDGARIAGAAPYLALERPALFADHDHLNAAGSAAFSALLGRDVAAALRAPFRPPAAQPSVAAPARQWGVRTLLGIGNPLRFQSYEFWVFVALVAAAFYAVPAALRRWVLLAASYYFYARWNAWYLAFLVVLTVSDYAIALGIERTRGGARRRLLGLGVAANLGFLGTFKYANFATGTASALLGMHANPWLVSLIVPIGISFHTFQSISYLVDVHRGTTRAVRRLQDYALYLAFFPQLLAGPIVRAALFFGELFNWHKPTAADVTYGLIRAGFGLFKKMGIADRFAPISDAYFAAPAAHPGALAAWCAVFAFAMQIYFDFSGYSDIAIGCARLFGFVFPENFVQPYLATSITDFWHRWHVTLSTWLRDYLYIPLGGSRHGTAATIRNLLLTMLLGGLWHGAQWTFVAWGAFHGALLSLERLTGIGRAGDRPAGAVYVARVALTFALVSLGWVLFRATSFGDAAHVYGALVAGGWGGWSIDGWSAIVAAAVVAYGALVLFAQRRGWKPHWNGLPPVVHAAATAGVLIALELFTWPGTPATFIYFKF